MKTYPWLLVIAFEIVCLSAWAAAELTESAYRRDFADIGFPALTHSVLAAKYWFPVAPLPWVIYSISIARRREVTPSILFTYTGTVIVALTAFICWMVLGLVLPYFSLHIMLGRTHA